MMNVMLTLVVLLFAIPCFAADVTVNWDMSDGAAGYKVYQSVDTGQTWNEIADVLVATANVVVPDSGLVLFRVSAYNNQGEVSRCDAGAWYNGDWTPPAQPTGTGIQ